MSARAWLALAAFCAWLGAAPLPAVAADAAPASGVADPLRDRLKSLNARWYDAEHDTWRSVDVQPQKPPKPPDVEAPGGGLLVTGIAWLVAATVLVALAWLIWQVVPKDGFAPLPEPDKPKAPGDPRATLLQLDVGETGDPESALAAAKNTGNWSRAVVWLYAILLLRLDRAGIVRVRRGATNQRYRQEVAAWKHAGAAPPRSAEVLATVDTAIAAFERVYFGQQPADRMLVELLETRIRAAVHAIPGEVER